LILGRHLVKVRTESPYVFGVISSYASYGGKLFWGLSDFDLIKIKFGMKVEFEVLNNSPKFGRNQLISCVYFFDFQFCCVFMFLHFVVAFCSLFVCFLFFSVFVFYSSLSVFVCVIAL